MKEHLTFIFFGELGNHGWLTSAYLQDVFSPYYRIEKFMPTEAARQVLKHLSWHSCIQR
jgi:hypothetical protein